MDSIRNHISFLKTLIEDSSVQPQHTIAYTNKMLYIALLIAKDSYIYELKINPNIKYKPDYVKYFIPCFTMNEVDIVECACAPNANCTWMKSAQPLPDFKGFKLDMVSPVNVTQSDDYGYVDWESVYDIRNSRKPERLNNKYTTRNINGDKYLYVHVFDKTKPRKLSLLGPFDDLFQVVDLVQNGCNDIKKPICNFLDNNLDIANEHRDKIYMKAIQIVKTLEDKNIFPDRRTDDIDGSKFIQDRNSN